MRNVMTLGSLFDGIGTWQLAATNVGIKPVWSSEIEKFPIEVTARHFPETIQLGDINAIENVPKVDIITASTPCQDLSIAGKRRGIHGERSGLFFKAIELVRRSHAEFFVWENVTGAFSSNGGNGFRAVLEEILEEPVPLPEHGWSNAGLVDGKRSQVAWRVCDAQYWGVPQRRKRIFLVADFAGRRAAQVLFEPASMSRDSSTSTREGQAAPARTGSGVVGTLAARDYKGVGNQYVGEGKLQIINGVVRRLTPLECERLMGLPDHWTSGGSDAARYKAIGNGMALPVATWILKRIKDAPKNRPKAAS